MSVRDAQEDLAELERRANALEAELAGVRKRMERLKIYLEVDEEYHSEGSAKPESEQASIAHLNGANHNPTAGATELPPLENEPLIEACRGKSIADAAIALIRLAGHPLSEKDPGKDCWRLGSSAPRNKTPTSASWR